jgi:CRP-like cAMP-binding protein
VSAGHTPFLKRLTTEDADALLALARRKSLTRGSVVMREGSAGGDVVLVVSGRVNGLRTARMGARWRSRCEDRVS